MVWDKKEGLSDVDRAIIGGAKRISIPLHNKMLLRDVADAFRGLAQTMDFQSRLDTVSEKDALLRVSHEINHTNRLIKAACKRYDVELREGRPPDSKRLGQKSDSARTSETVLSPKPLHIVNE